MKKGIHPAMYADAKQVCTTCGAIYRIPTTVKELHVESCRACHPIYTGKKQAERRGGRIERYRKRASVAKK